MESDEPFSTEEKTAMLRSIEAGGHPRCSRDNHLIQVEPVNAATSPNKPLSYIVRCTHCGINDHLSLSLI